ncbi:MAG TPA: DUF4139 domain-containing protein [Sedimentisphaerales bacterium]|jgi:hypothetical protein|nr:DUF4139 domain-containing protein [Sedimentisphaerales bacterium]HNU27866.1 DUF4139 domain-containing protein [Sedimentisphaerales bacterium]
MNTHLTDQQLIDYQFDLACEADSNEARTHLEKCEACRKRLQELARKLSALEVLRDDVKASPELLSTTIRTAMRANDRRILLHRLPWLGAVAAAVIVGIALLSVPNRAGKDAMSLSPSAPGVAMSPRPKGAVEEPPLAEQAVAVGHAAQTGEMLAMNGTRDSAGPVRSVPVRAYLDFQEEKITPYGVTTNGLATAIDEQPPFAPASAIELVVLPRREDVQLTIYNAADLTLVRERRNLTLKRGWNWLQFMWANTLIDPTSLHLEPLEHKDRVEVQQLVFPPRLRELGRWLIHSEIEGPTPFELTYFTSGLSWRAFYMGTLSQDEKTMHLEGYVRVNNSSGEDYEDAKTRLIVGQVHLLDAVAELARRQYAYGSPVLTGVLGGVADNGLFLEDKSLVVAQVFNYGGDHVESLKRKDIQKEGLSEYFLYTIEGTETIPNEWGKRLLSFEANDVPVKSLCKYDEERWGDRTIRFLSLANDKEHKLGETPIPDGTVRVYGRADEQGHLSYVGGTRVKYIPVGEEVELELGRARLVEVKPVLMDVKTENHTFDTKGEVNGWDRVRTWKIEVVNAHTLPVEIEVTRGFETAYWSLTPAGGDATYRKHDATHARFELTVPPRQTQVFEYELTTYHGVRQEALSVK